MDEYVVTINGVEHTMQLDAEDAERYGDNAKKVGSTSTKARSTTTANKSREE